MYRFLFLLKVLFKCNYKTKLFDAISICKKEGRMKKINLLSLIGSIVMCGVCALSFNGTASANDIDSIISNENNVSIRRSSYKETRDSSYEAIVSIFAYDGNPSSSSSSFLNFNGHAFITIENLNANSIKAGKMTAYAYETVSLSTWGNKSQHNGLWYNLESYFANKGEYDGRVSLSRYTTSSELETLNSYINSHDSWSAFTNCSSFATGAWNTISSTKLSAGWINTPSNLKGSIKKNSYSINRAIGYNSNVGYYTGDTFNYVNMNSKGILDSEMVNPNSL